MRAFPLRSRRLTTSGIRFRVPFPTMTSPGKLHVMVV